MRPGAQNVWGAYLTPAELVELEASEDAIRLAAAQLHKAKRERQRISNLGIGRARWDLKGRAEHQAARGLAGYKPRNLQPEDDQL